MYSAFENGELSVRFDPAKTAPHEIVAEIARAFPVTDIIIEEEDIDKIIADMYRDMKFCL